VAMTAIDKLTLDDTANIILYADDIALLVGAARPPTAFSRIEKYLDGLKSWAKDFGLEFSSNKTQLLSIKGGLKAGYSVGFGTEPGALKITSGETAKYLGVILVPRQRYWDHVQSLKNKSTEMYNRLRRLTSANWGMSRNAAKIIYEAVFLPRVSYAAEIWEQACLLKKSINLLGSMQRAPLRVYFRLISKYEG